MQLLLVSERAQTPRWSVREHKHRGVLIVSAWLDGRNRRAKQKRSSAMREEIQVYFKRILDLGRGYGIGQPIPEGNDSVC